jgi:hypothetical protein
MKLAFALAAATVGIAAVGASAASQPIKVGGFSTIFEGQNWSLVAWRSQSALCWSYGAPGSAGNGCGVRTTRPLSVLIASLGKKEQFVLGTARAGIFRVTLMLTNGKVIRARLRAVPAKLRTRVAFFEIDARIAFRSPIAGGHALGLIRGFDKRGRIVSSFRL